MLRAGNAAHVVIVGWAAVAGIDDDGFVPDVPELLQRIHGAFEPFGKDLVFAWPQFAATGTGDFMRKEIAPGPGAFVLLPMHGYTSAVEVVLNVQETARMPCPCRGDVSSPACSFVEAAGFAFAGVDDVHLVDGWQIAGKLKGRGREP